MINQRRLKSSTILTTNVGIADWAPDWAGAFGNATVAAAMLDRLLHRAAVVGIDGPSYRLRSHRSHSTTSAKGDRTCWLNSGSALSAGRHSRSTGAAARHTYCTPRCKARPTPAPRTRRNRRCY
ncbi:ATP-binding protein [Streptomyces sp. HMX112]|uniref:ATP-binding protein n=1 Tax=Streptomyces sp. HMX112 TaxID=3390850 RepID=UPI003A80E299